MSEITDQELISRHLAGHDHTAFETLVRRHAPGLFGYLKQFSGNRSDAEDLLQETFK
ncbi:MAG: hypothetical protein D6820_07820, partial [Lentisphaerae bacterium]